MGYYKPMDKEDKYEVQKYVEKAQNLLGAHKKVVKVVVHSIVAYHNNRSLDDPEWQCAPVSSFSKAGMGKVSISVLEKAQDICRNESAIKKCVEKAQNLVEAHKNEPESQNIKEPAAPRKRRIKSTDTLYQYVFDKDGGMSFDTCYILNMSPKRGLGKEGEWVLYPENAKIAYARTRDGSNPMRFYVYEEDVDTRFSSFSQYKTLVLSKQDDEKALDIYIEALGNRIEELEDQIGSFRDQIRMAEERKAGWITEN